MTWLWALLGAFLLGVIGQNLASICVGAALGALGAQLFSLQKQVLDLQSSLERLRAELAARAATESAGAPREQHATASSDAQANIVATPAPVATGSPPVSPAPLRESKAQPQPAPPPGPAHVAYSPTWLDRAVAAAVAWIKGGNPLARIGIVVLFFGAAFLAKYATDHSLFPIELRFIAIACGALALLIVGWRLRSRRPAYAEVLEGGGVAGLYLTVFAAASLYGLLPLGLAFALMVGIALAAAALALAQHALSLAVIGTAGGFLAPILVSTGSGNHIALFSYYAILNLGIFAIAWFRTWRSLNVLGFVFTFGITSLWRATRYTSDEVLSADAFLILFFLMYVGVSILNALRQPPKLKDYVSGSLVFGLPIVAFTLHATLVARFEYALAWSALAAGALYLALASALMRSGRPNVRLLSEAFAALGVIFASLAIPLAFDTRTTAAMWAVEGAGLVWLGVRQNRKLARAFGVLLQVAGGIGFLLGVPHPSGKLAFLNTAFMGAAMLAFSGWFTGYTLFRHRERVARYERGASEAAALWGTAWWLFGGLGQIDRLASDWPFGLILIYVAATGVGVTLAGLRWAWPMARSIGVFLPLVAIPFASLVAFFVGHPFGEGGIVGWIALFGVLYGALHRAERDALVPRANAALHAIAAWALVALAAWEAHWQLDRHAAGVWPALAWGIVPTLAVAILGRRTLKPMWPLARHEELYRIVVAAPLVASVALWIVYVDLTNRGDPVWLPYVPLLNPLDLTVALALTASALWWTALSKAQRATVWRADARVLIAIVAGVVFLWLNAALIRTLHHNFGAPITWLGMARSQLVQAALSIFWAVLGFAAMTLAARKRWRYVWIVGVALMLVVVAKLFLVDLSNVGTLGRTVSFLTIGALIVVTGYLAPLPPRPVQEQSATGSEEAIKP
jgi:uncharacterized membrane protein